jgi:hypothetical protein
MSKNTNDWVKELLSWHGHDHGGVHVPFQNTNPLGTSPLETSLIVRLRGLSRDLATNKPDCPRWIFLIGGPGNGKSETIQDFLSSLDNELSMGGKLIDFLKTAFSPQPLVPRRIQISSQDVQGIGKFSEQIGRLIVVQDATATDDALGNSANQLVSDILDLTDSTETPLPVFVICANRGLLARALKEAQLAQTKPEVINLLEQLIKASSLGVETLVVDGDRPSCWPLNNFPQAACWPFDLESLLISENGIKSPIEQIVEHAINPIKWDQTCNTCDAKDICPFFQNSNWLRDANKRKNLLQILRRGELFLGQRWNFRDSFSLIAELMVGQWTDFDPNDHPCLWVHDLNDQSGSAEKSNAIDAVMKLTRRLYPHALFPTIETAGPTDSFLDLSSNHPLTIAIGNAWNNTDEGSKKSIRDRLSRDYLHLDTAAYTPRVESHKLRLIENDYSQSIQQGNEKYHNDELASAEKILLNFMGSAETEWESEFLGRNAKIAIRMISYLKRLSTFLVKRTLGVKEGFHANQEYLQDYERSMHDYSSLSKIIPQLRKLLGADDKFRFNVMQSFGQPNAEEKSSGHEVPIALIGNLPGTRVHTASAGNDQVPRHDVPFFRISDNNYPIPLTFDFYLALRLRQEGCASSSLPASVRAAVDKVKQQLAGILSRSAVEFMGHTATIQVMDSFSINLNDATTPPFLERKED